MNNCENFNEIVVGNYCANCGQSVKLSRIDGSYIINEITNSFLAKRGILYTVKKMLISPGENVKLYINKNRSMYIKPITFVIITSLIYTLVCHFFNIDADEFQQQMNLSSESLEIVPSSTLITNWVIDYSGYASIILGFFMAFWVKLIFRKYPYNLFEIFVLFCYISGITTLISSVIYIIQGLTHYHLINFSVLITVIYTTWAIGQFFDKRKVGSYIKAFFSYLVNLFAAVILLGFIMVFIDVVLKG